MSYVYNNIHEYLNKINRIINLFGKMAMSQILLGTNFYSLG